MPQLTAANYRDEKTQAFFGQIPRGDAEQSLREVGSPGTFLLRISSSSKGDYVLSMMDAHEPLHFQVKQQGECWFCIDDGPLFEGLQNCVEHYRHNQDGLPKQLNRPVAKKYGQTKHGNDSQLHTCAASIGQHSHVAALVGRKEHLKVNNRQRTPLHEAALHNNVDCVRELLRHGRGTINLDAQDDMMWTPLHLAAYNNHAEVTKHLIASGAQYSSENSDGETPLQLACRMGNSLCAKILGEAQRHGVRTHDMMKLRAFPWIHGGLQRKSAEHVLSIHGNQDGLFLLRESSQVKNDFVLSLCSGGSPFHFQVQQNGANCYYIDDGPLFEGLGSVIEYYRTKPDGLPAMLRSYCSVGCGSMRSPRPLTLKKGETPIVSATATMNKRRGKSGGDGGSDSDDDDDDYNHMSDIPGKKASSVPALVNQKELVLGKELGQGEFGKVLAGKWQREGSAQPIDVAVKTFTDTSDGAMEEFLREAEVMNGLQHRYVVRLHGLCLNGGNVMIVQELVVFGALLQYLEEKEEDLRRNPSIMTLFGAQVATGMEFLDSKKVVHRDLATRNVLVATPKHVKISDFGLSRARVDSDYYTASTGGKWPVKWYAPESVYYGKFTSASDVWSFGVTLWEIWTFGQLPYEELTGREVLEQIELGKRLDMPQGCDQATYAIMHKCWVYERESRATFKILKKELADLLPQSLKSEIKLQ